jgi:hypothetical protein
MASLPFTLYILPPRLKFQVPVPVASFGSFALILMLPLGFNKTWSAGTSHITLETSCVCGMVAIGVITSSTGLIDGTGVLEGNGIIDGAGVLEGNGVIDGTGVLVGNDVIDGAGVLDGNGVVDGTGVLDGIGVIDGVGVGTTVTAQLGTLICVLAALAVTAVWARILPFVTEFAPNVIADLLITVPARVLFAPIVATFGTQNISQG